MNTLTEYFAAWTAQQVAFDLYTKNIGSQESDENYKLYFLANAHCEALAKKCDLHYLRAFIAHALAYTNVKI